MVLDVKEHIWLPNVMWDFHLKCHSHLQKDIYLPRKEFLGDDRGERIGMLVILSSSTVTKRSHREVKIVVQGFE